MGTRLDRQGLALLLALGLGLALGLAYDFLRPLRHRLGRGWGAALDVLFCLVAGAAAFVYAMGAGNGRLGLWALGAALLGFLLYLHTLSAPVLRLLTAGLDLLCNIMGSCKKIIVQTAISAKNLFQKMRKYFIVNK